MGLAIFTGAHGSKFVGETGFGEEVASISIAADAPIIAHAREPRARPLLARLGKKDQGTLYRCAQERIRTGICPRECGGDCNPANRPGQSTHERRNDGVAYGWWPVGWWLPKWARGIDVRRDRVAAFCEEARRRGYTVTVTYPGSPNESQHVGFRKAPKIDWWRTRPVKLWSRGRRAREAMRLLHTVVDPSEGHPYFRPRDGKLPPSFGHAAVAAVKAFQRDHLQKPDGVVGTHTIRALRAAKRRQARKRKGKR